MLESRPPSSPGILFGALLLIALILLDLGMMLLILNQPVTVLSFIWGVMLFASLPAFAFIAFWTSSLSSTRYLVEANTLAIEWGRIRQIISLTQVRSLVAGESMQMVADFKGVRWPGYLVGQGHVSGEDQVLHNRPTLFYATRPLRHQLLLVMDTVNYGVSPIDLDNFVACLKALRIPELGGGKDTPPPARSFLNWHLWDDRPAQLTLLAAIMLNGALFAFLCFVFGRLPSVVPLHFDVTGAVDRLTSPVNLFVLPILGLLSWVFNGILGFLFYQVADERPPAFVLWGAAVVVQAITWVALYGLLS